MREGGILADDTPDGLRLAPASRASDAAFLAADRARATGPMSPLDLRDRGARAHAAPPRPPHDRLLLVVPAFLLTLLKYASSDNRPLSST